MSKNTELAEAAKDLVPKLTKEQYDLLLYFEQYYWRRGGLPTYEQITSEGIELEETFYLETWNNSRFLDGLRGRGIPEHLLDVRRGAFNGKILTEKQLTVANALLDVLDKRSRLKKLTELGVSTAEYNSWLRDPVYRQYCLDRAEDLLGSNQHIAHTALIDRVSQGDLGAIKYFNALTGRYRDQASRGGVEVNVQNNYGMEQVVAIIEIIQRHVKDPATLAAIGDDILALRGGGQSGSGGHSGAPVITAQPQPFQRGA